MLNDEDVRNLKGLLVYTSVGEGFRQLDSELRARLGWPRSPARWFSRFLFSVVPDDQRPPADRDGHAQQEPRRLLRGDGDRGVGARLPVALLRRTKRWGGVPSQAVQGELHRAGHA